MKFLYAIALTTIMTSHTLPALFTEEYYTRRSEYESTYTGLKELHNTLLEKKLITSIKEVETPFVMAHPEEALTLAFIASMANTAIVTNCLLNCTQNFFIVASTLIPTFLFSYILWKMRFIAQTPDGRIKKLLTPIESTIKHSRNSQQIDSILHILQSEKEWQSKPGKGHVAILINQCILQSQNLSH